MDNFGLWSLVPPIAAIVLALLTREIVLSLFVAIFSGTAIHACMTHSGAVSAFRAVVDLIGGKMAENMPMVLFLCLLGALVSVVTRAGGARAYGEWAFRRLKSETSVNLMTIVMGLIIFIDDYFNCLTVGSVMTPVTDSQRISRVKLAYLIDATAAPICMIAPISSWAAAVSGVAAKLDTGVSGIQLFIEAIPYNFYSLLTIVFVITMVVLGVDYGPMAAAELKASQSTASLYQFAVRSVNGVSPLTVGPPTKLYRICTSCARVVTPRGAKTCVSMPDM